MNYGRVLSRAWEITWRWKVLWILGFLASLGSGMGSGTNVYSSSGGQEWDAGPWAGQPPDEFWLAFGGIILGVLCLGLLVAIALTVVSIISRGGLVAGVQQVEEEGDTTFGQAWRVGVSRFWTLFGIAILTAIPAIILMLLLGGLVVAGIVVGVGMADVSEAATVSTIISALVCAGALCCLMIPLAIILDLIRTYAERAAILEGLGWIDAFKRGWEVLKENPAPTAILWLIFLAIGFVLAALIAIGMMAIALPFIPIWAKADPGPWVVVPICCGGLLGIILVALISAVVTTFTSAAWTLAYRDLTGWPGAAAAAEELPPEEELPPADEVMVLVDLLPEEELPAEDPDAEV
jgi:hypothetical protein